MDLIVTLIFDAIPRCLHVMRRAANAGGYGLLWFTGRLHGQRVAWAWGYGGQFALLVPELKLAVATAATSPQPSALRQQTDAVMSLVGKMVQATGSLQRIAVRLQDRHMAMAPATAKLTASNGSSWPTA